MRSDRDLEVAIEHLSALKGESFLEVMTVAEIIEFLRVSRPTLYAMIKRREIPCQRVGKDWRFYRPAIIAWLQKGEDRVSRSRRKT